jgi:tetratricopeptide (TPR) repeat protein
LADYGWRAAVAYFPNAVNQPDLTPAVRERLRSQDHNRPPKLQADKRPVRKTSFDRHAYALAWYHAENWKEAIKLFEESAKLRQSGHAYDWLFMAMAHYRLGNHPEAQEWLGKSKLSLKSINNPPAELIKLRDQTERLMRRDGENATQVNYIEDQSTGAGTTPVLPPTLR